MGPRWRSPRVAIAGAALVLLVGASMRLGPLPPELMTARAHEGVRVLDRRGELLYSTLSERGVRSRPLGAGEIPPAVLQATLAAEDHRFFSHPGVDPVAALRALFVNFRAGRAVEGGSTLSQQTIDLLRGLGSRPSLITKAEEAILALRLEHRLSKESILALYLQIAPYGNNRVGIVEAADFYFGVAPGELTTAQAAFLAGLPRAPTRFDPLRAPARALARQRVILARMERFGFIDSAARSRAEEERIEITPQSAPPAAHHFVERVLAASPERTGTIRTTLDADLQREIGGIIRAQKERLTDHGASAVAVAVLDNRTGEWLGWEGSGDYFGATGAIDGVITPRQPGSALKPFTYALAFERGLKPSAPLPDVPSTFPTAESGIVYKPRNYDGRFRGPLLPRVALASSVNVPAIWTLSQIGVEPLLHRLRRLGFTTLTGAPDFYGYGLTMGDAEVRLDQLVAAYATLARRGKHVTPRFIEDPSPDPTAPRVLDEAAAFLVSDMLADDDARESGFGRGSPLEFVEARVAVKTGTSQSYRDNWTVGFTGDVTVGVWVGNFDRRALRGGSSGVTGAAPIFHAVMEAALRRYRTSASDAPFEAPAGVESREVCALSGEAPGPYCPRRVREWMPRAASLARCSWHGLENGAPLTRWPAEYVAWARDRATEEAGARAVASSERPTMAIQASARAGSASALAVTSPPDGATYWIDPTLRREFQSVRLRAKGGRGALVWSVNGREVAGGADDPKWRLVPGEHVVEVRDEAGRRAAARVRVH